MSFSKSPCQSKWKNIFPSSKALFFPPKLSINPSKNLGNDKNGLNKHEVFERLAPMTDTQSLPQLFFRPVNATVQRNGGDGEEGMKLRRKERPHSYLSPVSSTENYLSKISGGQELNEKERRFFEPRMNADFSKVKIHTDAAANESAKGLHALAYTYGNHIVFGSDQYHSHADKGKKLMAHELTHVIQQNGHSSLSTDFVQRYDDPALWCNAFMDLVRYEDAHGKWGVITHYHSLSNERLVPLNYNIPSIFGDVDVDWMFRLAFIQYPFIVSSIFTPSMSEGFGGIASRVGQIGLKGFWNTLRAAAPEWDLEYGSVLEEGNWNSSTAIVAWIHQDLSLRDIFSPAISLC